MQILFISFSFPPTNSIGSIRSGKTAKYLIELGNDLDVICHQSLNRDQSAPLEIEKSKCHRVTTKSFDEFISSDYYTYPKLKKVQFRIEIALRHKNYFYLLPDSSWSWYNRAINIADDLIDQKMPDLIFSTALPISSHFIARKLSKKYKIPWVAEYRDLWSGDHGQGISYWSSLLKRSIEKWLLKPVKGVVTVSEPLADYFKSSYDLRTTVVYNGYDFKKKSDVSNEIDTSSLRIVYTGNFYRGYDPSMLFEAISQLKKQGKNIKVQFYTAQKDLLQIFINKYELNELIEVHGLVPYQKSIEIQHKADILLFLSYQDEVYRGKGILSGKVFEYLATGRPILSIGADSEHLLIKEKIMKHPNNFNDLLKTLHDWLREKEQNGFLQLLDEEEKRKRYSRLNQTKKLNSFLALNLLK